MTVDVDFWNGIAEKYAAQPVERPDAFDRKIEITRALMKPGCEVLDVGCGTGSLALRLAPSAGRVHGLDCSKEMARIANKKAADQGVENVEFHVGPFDESFSVFADGSLDGICAYSILHLVEDRSAALRQIFRLLKPGGFFVSSTVCLGDSWVPYRPLLTVMRWLGKSPPVSVFRRNTLEADIRATGFVDVSAPDVGAQPTVAFYVARKPS